MKAIHLISVAVIMFLISGCGSSDRNRNKEAEPAGNQIEEPITQIPVKGKITDLETGKNISMAFIIVKGTTIGTISDPDGVFALQVPGGAKKLVISREGYETYEADVNSKEEMAIKLTPKK